MGIIRTAGAAGVVAWLALAAAPSGAQPRARVWTELANSPGRAPALPDLAALVERAGPAVVSVVVEQRREGGDGDDALHELFERFYGDEPTEGLGAGFIVHPSGLVVTNAHVIENHREIRVVLDERGEEVELVARELGRDAETDVALLKVDAGHPLPVVPLGDSDEVRVADWVVAIGNPFGLAQSVTFGIVSQKGRTDVAPHGREGYFDFIQTDASMNPGSSGGPLLNLRGEVVAINNAINASGQGIGFAVPINMVKQVLPQLAAEGKVTRSWIGLTVQDLSPDTARGVGVARHAGVVVSEVVPGGPAARAGLSVGDVIVRFGGKQVKAATRLRWDVACAGVGRSVPVELVRDGREVSIAVTLAQQPEAPKGLRLPAVHFLGGLGFAIEDVEDADALGEGLVERRGARVVEVEPEGIGRRAGLRKGDLLVGVGASELDDAEQLAEAVDAAPGGTILELRVRRSGEELTLPLRKP